MKRRNTPSKEAVLNLLKDAGKAMSHDAIEKQIVVDIDRATIYRVLNSFCTDGLVHRIVAEDGKQYFAVWNKYEDKQEADYHFYFRCMACQTIECLPETVHFSTLLGYTVNSVNCVITGTCKDCTVT